MAIKNILNNKKGCKNMKTEIKNRIKNLIENYRKVINGFLAEIKKWEENSYYTSDAKKDEIRKVKSQMKEADLNFNGQLSTIVMEEKDAIVNSTIKRPTDYQVQISNALKFIELAGDKLTDEQAFELVKPFLGDHQTMKYFYAAISRMNGLYVTSSILGSFEKIEKKFDVFHNTYKNFFNNGTYATNSLLAVMKESAIINDIEPIEELIQRFSDVIPASYEEAKDEIENNIQDKMGV
jgi:hypothetical protein